MKRMLSIIPYLIAGLLGMFVFSLLITGIITRKPSFFGVRPYFIMSESMEPAIKTHQIVLAAPVEADEVEPGDIIDYRRAGSVYCGYHIIHRVLEVTDDGFIFKGDNNKNAVPDIVSREQILYQIVWF